MNELASNPENLQAAAASRRRPRLVSSWAALLAIRQAFSSKEVKIRRRDRISDLMLMCALVYALAIYMFPVQARPMVGVADLVFGLTFFLYITQRLGIITTLNERQTLLIAELLFCMILAGMYLAVNIAAIYVWLRLAGP